MTINFRVDYEPAPIRHVAVQCPHCEKWFRAWEITTNRLQYESDLDYAQFICPKCEKRFYVLEHWFDEYRDVGNERHTEELSYPDIYKDCLEQKEVWE